ncbi:MAG: hypothetical protein K9G76_09505 [Bacteroidales bacterium]|nr:hypothetical protein [Bacteroidales bacterium]MCF8403934.1 hypothetical protein [Bacteroidales bacterium]
MNINEIKDAIQKAKSPEWFKKIKLSINYPSVNAEHNLEGFSSIYIYFQQQKEGWDSLKGNIPSILNTSATYFNEILNQLKRIVTNAEVLEESQISQSWNNVHNAVHSLELKNVFTYDSPETEYIIDLNGKLPDYVNDVFNFFTAQNQNIDPNTKKRFIAYLLAYEFLQKDHTKITERRNKEKASISKIRNDFKKYLNDSEVQLNNFLNDSKTKNEKFAEQIDNLKIAKEETFDNWYKEATEKHQKLVDDTTVHRGELESTYMEHLRLKGPAEYWKKRSIELKKQGWNSLYWLIGLVFLGTGLLFALLLLIPGDALANIFKTTGSAIKWSVIFITFISFMAYGIGLLSKITFSAFHLARDAEEREQLTYLYLSLKKDGNVDEKDRQLVLQSLFSRADTGLLKDDASPTMPGATGFINRFISQKD